MMNEDDYDDDDYGDDDDDNADDDDKLPKVIGALSTAHPS